MTDRKRQILDAALSLFATEGFYKCTVRKIGEKAGLDNSSLFYHFNSKEAMLEAILDEFKGLFAAERTPVEELVALAGHKPLTEVFLRFFHPVAPPGETYDHAISLFKAVESLKHEHEKAKQVYTEYAINDSRKYIESVLIALIDAGKCRPVDTHWFAYYFHSFALRIYVDSILAGMDYENGVGEYMSGIRLFCENYEQLLKP